MLIITFLGASYSAGFIIPKPEMPGWLIWIYYLSPPAWAIYALVADQLGDKGDTVRNLTRSEWSGLLLGQKSGICMFGCIAE